MPTPLPTLLDTPRLALRAFTATDADVDRLTELDSDPEVMRFINGGRPTSPELVRSRQLPRLLHRHPDIGTYGYWAAEEKATGEFLGWFEFRPLDDQDAHSPLAVELGYRLRRIAWGRGYATEGSRALIHKGFTDLGVQRVTANTMSVNTRSRQVMTKVGLTYRRTYFDEWPEAIEGSEHGEVEYALTKPEWEQRQAQGAETVGRRPEPSEDEPDLG